MTLGPINDDTMLKLTALGGSARLNSYTGGLLNALARQVQAMPEIELDVLDPRELRLAVPGLESDPADVEQLRERVRAADGVILATPEYHGSFSSTMKLMIDNLGHPNPLKAKPVLLFSVGASRHGGIKPLEHLRSIASHLGAWVYPSILAVNDCRNRLTPEGEILDEAVQERLPNLIREFARFTRTNTRPVEAERESPRRA